MAIKIIDQKPDVYVTESEYRRLRDEYYQAYMHYSGTPPSLEDFIRERSQPHSQVQA